MHILLTLDEDMLVALPSLISSVLSSTKMSVLFHIMWCEDNAHIIKQYLSCFKIKGFDLTQLDVRGTVNKFMPPVFKNYINYTATAHKRISRCSNIIRLQAHRIFPYLEKVLFLDADMVVQGKSYDHLLILKYKLTKNIVSAVTWLSQQHLTTNYIYFIFIYRLYYEPVLLDQQQRLATILLYICDHSLGS